MLSSKALLAAIEGRMVAQQVGRRHDDFFMRYRVDNLSPRTFDEYEKILGDYYNAHQKACISRGTLSPARAQEEAKQIVQRQYERRDEDIVNAFNDACDGTSGGLSEQLGMIRDALKRQDEEMYINHVFDTHMPPGGPGAFEQRKAIIADFIARFGEQLADSIDAEHPERYAGGQYKALIRAYVESLNRAGSQFRRM